VNCSTYAQDDQSFVERRRRMARAAHFRITGPSHAACSSRGETGVSYPKSNRKFIRGRISLLMFIYATDFFGFNIDIEERPKIVIYPVFLLWLILALMYTSRALDNMHHNEL